MINLKQTELGQFLKDEVIRAMLETRAIGKVKRKKAPGCHGRVNAVCLTDKALRQQSLRLTRSGDQLQIALMSASGEVLRPIADIRLSEMVDGDTVTIAEMDNLFWIRLT